MPYARTLQRSLNLDLVAQIEAKGKVTKAKKVKTKKVMRSHLTYRWARRNISHHGWRV